MYKFYGDGHDDDEHQSSFKVDVNGMFVWPTHDAMPTRYNIT